MQSLRFYGKGYEDLVMASSSGATTASQVQEVLDAHRQGNMYTAATALYNKYG